MRLAVSSGTMTLRDRIASPHFGWAFTVNHAHLVPERSGYAKHYTMAYGNDAVKLASRDRLIAKAG